VLTDPKPFKRFYRVSNPKRGKITSAINNMPKCIWENPSKIYKIAVFSKITAFLSV
jgi:hypothetical protein